jgi:hypothetical protein
MKFFGEELPVAIVGAGWISLEWNERILKDKSYFCSS